MVFTDGVPSSLEGASPFMGGASLRAELARAKLLRWGVSLDGKRSSSLAERPPSGRDGRKDIVSGTGHAAPITARATMVFASNNVACAKGAC